MKINDTNFKEKQKVVERLQESLKNLECKEQTLRYWVSVGLYMSTGFFLVSKGRDCMKREAK
jgi:23S rRNA G2069 N7-methylase RlmK/C1962 C5-methylase RlmI